MVCPSRYGVKIKVPMCTFLITLQCDSVEKCTWCNTTCSCELHLGRCNAAQHSDDGVYTSPMMMMMMVTMMMVMVMMMVVVAMMMVKLMMLFTGA